MQIKIFNLANEMEIEILASMEEMKISRLKYLICKIKYSNLDISILPKWKFAN